MFELKKPSGGGSIVYAPIFCAPGGRGFFGEGYPWHRYAKFLGMTWKRTSFAAKTVTLEPTKGNMPLKKDGLTPKEFKPKCIEVYPYSGHLVNAVGLSNAGLKRLSKDGRWQDFPTNFMLSFMPQGNDLQEKVENARKFVRAFIDFFLRNHFRSQFALQVNCACPNTKTDTACLLSEAEEILGCFEPLRELGIPIVANFNPLVPVETIRRTEPFCDAFWIANTVPWGQAADRIDWRKFARSVTRRDEHGFAKEVVPVDKNGLPVSPLILRGMPAAGGLSGPDCLPITIDTLRKIRSAGISAPIVAGNGIQCGEDVRKVADAGASAVAISSVALLRPHRMRGIIRTAHEVFSERSSTKFVKEIFSLL